MNCDLCSSKRVLEIDSKASDLHSWVYMGREGEGYAPRVPHICGGDYIHLVVCLDCGKVQGKFPVASESLIESIEVSDATKYFWENYDCVDQIAYYLGRMNPSHITDDIGRHIIGGGSRHTLTPDWNKEVECFFIDRDPDANWSHSCTYVFINPERNMKMCEVQDAWPPHHSIEKVKITK